MATLTTEQWDKLREFAFLTSRFDVMTDDPQIAWEQLVNAGRLATEIGLERVAPESGGSESVGRENTRA